MWTALRASRWDGLKFRRQVPIGPYVADFYCHAHRLIIELDGAPHENPDQRAHDLGRDAWLRGQGYRIVRLSNDLVLTGCDLALARIAAALR